MCLSCYSALLIIITLHHFYSPFFFLTVVVLFFSFTQPLLLLSFIRYRHILIPFSVMIMVGLQKRTVYCCIYKEQENSAIIFASSFCLFHQMNIFARVYMQQHQVCGSPATLQHKPPLKTVIIYSWTLHHFATKNVEHFFVGASKIWSCTRRYSIMTSKYPLAFPV